MNTNDPKDPNNPNNPNGPNGPNDPTDPGTAGAPGTPPPFERPGPPPEPGFSDAPGAAGASAPPPPPPPASGISAEERQWAMFAHLSSLLGGLLTAGWAGCVGCFIGPLIIWLVKKDTMPFVDDQAKEALNFNITVAIVFLALLVLSIVTLGIGLIIAIPLWVIIGIGWLVLTIVAAVKANEGVAYRYPLTLRLIK